MAGNTICFACSCSDSSTPFKPSFVTCGQALERLFHCFVVECFCQIRHRGLKSLSQQIFFEEIGRRKTTCTFRIILVHFWSRYEQKKHFYLDLIWYQLMHPPNHKHFMGGILKLLSIPSRQLVTWDLQLLQEFSISSLKWSQWLAVSWCVRECVCDACLCLCVCVCLCMSVYVSVCSWCASLRFSVFVWHCVLLKSFCLCVCVFMVHKGVCVCVWTWKASHGKLSLHSFTSTWSTPTSYH